MAFFPLLVVFAFFTTASSAPFTQIFLKKSTNTPTANDGTQYFIYFRPSSNPQQNKWIIYMMGGWWCLSENWCQNRWKSQQFLMSSDYWSDQMTQTGILSSDPQISKFSDFHAVFLPYLTSDIWMGTKNSSFPPHWIFDGENAWKSSLFFLLNGFSFQGQHYQLQSNSQILWTGSSAGGLGSLFTGMQAVEIINSHLKANVGFKLLPDSGYGIPNVAPFQGPNTCQQPNQCTYNTSMHMGHTQWGIQNSQLNPGCLQIHSSNPSLCLFAPNLKYTVPTLLPVYLFDSAFLTMADVNVANVLKESTPEWDFAIQVSKKMKSSFGQVTENNENLSIFSPGCVSHVLSAKDETWNGLIVDGIRFSDFVYSWFESTSPLQRVLVDKCMFPKCNPTCPPGPW